MEVLPELSQIITADGEIYDMQDVYDDTRVVLVEPGPGGFAPQRFFTRRTYRGDGEIETDAPRFDPRDLVLNFRLKTTCSRSQFWQARRDLLDMLRPNRGGPITYIFTRADESKRAIKGRPITPLFEPVMDGDNWGFTTDIQIRCFDPIWYDPDSNDYVVVESTNQELVFDIVFDDDEIIFGDEGFYGEQIINYVGSWYSYPVITINGPCSSVELKHLEKEIAIYYLQPIAIGDSIEIDLPNRVYTDQDGNKVVLGSMSKIEEFRIEPHPVLTDGINTFRFNLIGFVSGTTSAQLSYYARWEGI